MSLEGGNFIIDRRDSRHQMHPTQDPPIFYNFYEDPSFNLPANNNSRNFYINSNVAPPPLNNNRPNYGSLNDFYDSETAKLIGDQFSKDLKNYSRVKRATACRSVLISLISSALFSLGTSNILITIFHFVRDLDLCLGSTNSFFTPFLLAIMNMFDRDHTVDSMARVKSIQKKYSDNKINLIAIIVLVVCVAAFVASSVDAAMSYSCSLDTPLKHLSKFILPILISIFIVFLFITIIAVVFVKKCCNEFNKMSEYDDDGDGGDGGENEAFNLVARQKKYSKPGEPIVSNLPSTPVQAFNYPNLQTYWKTPIVHFAGPIKPSRSLRVSNEVHNVVALFPPSTS
ncbi:hypothetical protein HELRODRAFT_180500 [Helobdella robusta]|uniref:Uncharacterized protein n=1 Tax=Helobdella robusta TaxID=6412 RepID=T1FFZ8_HELRO|nr:hypothetical protein HELRODRAFT_180500 [Helobdella robusta]ESN93849.1 hypothetical protein HELRODRAFT_180500 [Helobdella robusta]